MVLERIKYYAYARVKFPVTDTHIYISAVMLLFLPETGIHHLCLSNLTTAAVDVAAAYFFDIDSESLLNGTNSTNTTLPPCPSYGSWPTNLTYVGPQRGFMSNGMDIAFQSCSNSSHGSNSQFVFYVHDIDLDKVTAT